MDKKTRLCVICQSAYCRQMFTPLFAGLPDMECAGLFESWAKDSGKLTPLNPDVLVLDIENIARDIESLLRDIRRRLPKAGILIIGSPDDFHSGAVETAIKSGATDYILLKRKFSLTDPPSENDKEALKSSLSFKIRSISIQHFSKLTKTIMKGDSAPGNTDPVPPPQPLERLTKLKETLFYRIVAVAVSTGGPEALREIISKLPANFPLPIVIVLHMPKTFSQTMLETIGRESELPLSTATDKDILSPGKIYLAPGGKHIIVTPGKDGQTLLETDDGPPENGCKPSADVLFRSVAETFGERTLAVILTGMGEDGVKGMGLLKEKGARTLAQDESSSVIWGMPGMAVEAGVVDEVVPLQKIAARIQQIARKMKDSKK